jgi:hypothetical protein
LRRSISTVGVLLFVILGASNAYSQQRGPIEQCTIGRNVPAVGFWTWPTNSKVNVYIRATDFDAKQHSQLLTGLKNWNSVSELTGSNVIFHYRGNTAQQVTCENCLTILRERVFDKATRHATEIRATSVGDSQLISSAAILVDPVLTDPEALLNAIVHELGHNFGLMDCYTCKRKSTVMNQLDSVNVPNGMERPTACDLAQVQEVYQQLKVRVRNAPIARTVFNEDEGEEPEDDDTPVVIPAPAKRLSSVVQKPAQRPE